MAITDPDYPITTADLVDHIGTYTDGEITTLDAAKSDVDHTHTGLTAQAAGTPSVRAIGSTGTTVIAGNDARLSAAAAGTASVRAIGTTSTTACAGDDARLSNTRTPADASVTEAKLATALKGLLTASLVHDGSVYPTRPSGFASVQWIGPDPDTAAEDGDTWVPTSA